MWGLPPLLSRPARPTNLVLGEIELSPLEVPYPRSPARWGTTSSPGLHKDVYPFVGSQDGFTAPFLPGSLSLQAPALLFSS